MNKPCRKVHYAWMIAAACFAMFFATYGLTNNSNNLYVVPITKSLGVGRGVFSLMFSVKFAVQCVLTMLFGWFSSRLGSRKMIVAGFLLLIGACLVISMAEGLALVYLGGALLGAGMAFASLNVVTVLLRSWFSAHRGLVTGVVMASTGLGGAVFSPIVGYWITQWGWRAAYRLAALILAAVGAVFISVIREGPADCGLSPLGSAAEGPEQAFQPSCESGLTLAEAAKTPYFYGCVILAFLFGALNNPVHGSVPAFLTDSGFSLSFAASVSGALFFGLACAKVLLGAAYDRLGACRATAMCLIANFTGLILLACVRHAWQAWLFALVFAVSIPMETVSMSMLASSLFGRREYRTFLGILTAGCQMGIAVGNPLLNYSYDLTGSYRNAYLSMAALSLATLALFLTIMKKALKISGE